jgi:hypothetical protein
LEEGVVLKFPRDISHVTELRKMTMILGDEGRAILLWFALMVQLGYECESTGVAGFLADSDEFIFVKSLHFPCDTPIAILEKSGLLLKEKGGWRCPIFEFYNAELDSSFVPPDVDANWKTFRSGQKAMLEETPQLLQDMPPTSWFLEDGRKLEEPEMRRVVMLVKSVDAILRVGKRGPTEYDLPHVHAAAAIIRDYSDVKIMVILKRGFEVTRKRGLPVGLPRNTLRFLQRWEDVIAAIMPSDGFERWAKRSQHVSMSK